MHPGSMHDTGCSVLGHWDDPEGWYGEGGGFRMESPRDGKPGGLPSLGSHRVGHD